MIHAKSYHSNKKRLCVGMHFFIGCGENHKLMYKKYFV